MLCLDTTLESVSSKTLISSNSEVATLFAHWLFVSKFDTSSTDTIGSCVTIFASLMFNEDESSALTAQIDNNDKLKITKITYLFLNMWILLPPKNLFIKIK